MKAQQLARRSAAALWLVFAGVLGISGVSVAALGVPGGLILLVLASSGVLTGLRLLMSDSRRSALVSAGAALVVAALAAQAWATTTPEAAAGNLAVLVAALGIACLSGASAVAAEQ